MQKNKFIFFGTPDISQKTLEILKENGYLPSLIITNPDKPQGRKLILTPSPVKTWAIQNNIPYLQPEKITEDFIDSLPDVELNIVIAYGKILPEKLINKPKLGSINIHYSLLPKYRGASPMEESLLRGEEYTGISIQQMVYKMDAGPILYSKETKIELNETIVELKEKLINLGGEGLIKILPEILSGNTKAIPQDENLATFCKKIKKEDALIDFSKDKDLDIYNKYRAYKIRPRIYFFENGKRVIITEAALENNKFKIKKIIKEGGKEQEYK